MKKREGITRIDSWAGTLSSLGSNKDRALGARFKRRGKLSPEQAEALYEENALAARIVDRMAHDATREGWCLKASDVPIDPAVLQSKCDDIGLRKAINTAIKWERKYGGALIVMGVDDGQPSRMPMRMDRVKDMWPLFVVPSRDAIPREWDAAFGSPTSQKVLRYDVRGLTRRGSIIVHHSRVIRFDHVELPQTVLEQGDGWGPSALDRVFAELSGYGQSRQLALSMMFIASIMYVKLQGWRGMAATDDGRTKLREALRDARQAMDSLGLFGMDSEDEIGATTLTMTGVHETMEKFESALVAATDYPREILIGQTPGGLNTGESAGPLRMYYDMVAAYQEDKITPAIDRILEVAFHAWGYKGATWTVDHEPLWQESDDEKAAREKMQAETHHIQWQMGVKSEVEIRGELGFRDEPEEPLSLTPAPGEVAPEAAPAAEVASPEDLALNGAQITGMLEIMRMMNAGEITYQQAIGTIGTAFPSMRGRETNVLGPPPATPPPGAPGVPTTGLEVEGEEPLVESPHAPPAGETLMSGKDIGAQLGISAGSVRSMHKRGEIGGWRIGGRWRYAISEVLGVAHQPKPGDEPEPEPEEEAA
jgi:hypothetical protein